MNYRSFSDLDACIARNLSKIPADVDIIAGIPRSGLLPATALALHLNLPLTDLQGVIEGRLFSHGPRLPLDRQVTVNNARRIAVVDDSVGLGQEMQRTRAKIEAAGLRDKVVYVAIYAADDSVGKVDIAFEVCPLPRVFAWNLMHTPMLSRACVDIDGVLCVDPSEEENDDGPRYLHFIETARPLLRPTREIGTLVTCRLEKYRPQTERWLQLHGIKYRELTMWDLPSKAARIASQGHAAYKASAFQAHPEADFFIESSAASAQAIANLTARPVICIESQRDHRAILRQRLSKRISRAVVSRVTSLEWVPRDMRRLLLATRAWVLRLSRFALD